MRVRVEENKEKAPVFVFYQSVVCSKGKFYFNLFKTDIFSAKPFAPVRAQSVTEHDWFLLLKKQHFESSESLILGDISLQQENQLSVLKR